MVVLFGSERMPALEPIIEGDELDPVVEAGGETGDEGGLSLRGEMDLGPAAGGEEIDDA